MRSGVRPVIKALGDDTRFQIYSWLREREMAATIAEIAVEFDLHPNTVRPHLDRLREADLVRLDARPLGTVGRPQHRYSAVEAEIGLHLGTEAYTVFTKMLAGLCSDAAVTPEQATALGRDLGRDLGVDKDDGPGPVLAREMERMGFELAAEGGCVVFTDCPFREVAVTYPELICSLHDGLTRGVVESQGGHVEEFRDVQASPEHCTATYD